MDNKAQNMRPRIPGITVCKQGLLISEENKNGVYDCRSNITARHESENRISRTINLGNWLKASIDTRYDESISVADVANGVSVLLDGYLTDIDGSHGAVISSAQTICHLYAEYGLSCLVKLRGSYVGIILDKEKDIAFLFNDRRGSRPIFYREQKNGSVYVGTEVRVLANTHPKQNCIDQVAACEFLMFGSFYSNDTIFPEIKKL